MKNQKTLVKDQVDKNKFSDFFSLKHFICKVHLVHSVISIQVAPYSVSCVRLILCKISLQ